MTTTKTIQPIERKLRRAWHKQRRFYHFRGLCYMLVWLVVQTKFARGYGRMNLSLLAPEPQQGELFPPVI